MHEIVEQGAHSGHNYVIRTMAMGRAFAYTYR